MRRRRGFTLIDVMMGFMLVGAMFYGIVSMVPVCLSSLRKGQHNAVCLNLARLTLESWQAQSFSTLTRLQPVGKPPQTVTRYVDATGTDLPVPPPAGSDPYTVVITVSDVDPPDANMKEVDVQVSSPGTGQSDAGFAQQTTWVYNYADPW